MPANDGDGLVGTWRLRSFHFKTDEGEISHPWGPEVDGYITYTERGRVAVNLMQANRPVLEDEELAAGSVEEKIAAYDGYIAYAGSYEIQGDRVIHHVQVSLKTNRIGRDLARFFVLEGDNLSLNTAPMPHDGSLQTAHLVFERV